MKKSCCPGEGFSLMERDLVTGGAGFIGSHLVDRLLAEGRHVRVLDNFSVGRRNNLEQHRDNPRLEIIEGDVADAASSLAACAGADRVFHLAARADVVPSVRNPPSISAPMSMAPSRCWKRRAVTV